MVKRYSCGCMSKECIKGTNINVASFTHLGKKTKRNASGCTGVSFVTAKSVTAKSKWMAQIYFNGKKKFLGYFDNKEDAIKARREAENDIYSLFSDVIDKLPNKNNAFSIREEK